MVFTWIIEVILLFMLWILGSIMIYITELIAQHYKTILIFIALFLILLRIIYHAFQFRLLYLELTANHLLIKRYAVVTLINSKLMKIIVLDVPIFYLQNFVMNKKEKLLTVRFKPSADFFSEKKFIGLKLWGVNEVKIQELYSLLSQYISGFH